MGRSKETFGKKEVRKKQEKKRKDKEAKRQAKKSGENSSGLDDMIAYVDEYGNITSTPPEENKKKEEIKAEDIEVSVPKGGFNDEESHIKKGIVAFFNDQKGYGFIRNLENNQNVFVHINNVEGQLKDGNRVTFEIGMGDKGPVALNVKLAD